MKRAFVLVLIACMALALSPAGVDAAAGPDPTWTRSFPFVAQALDIAADGTVVVGGSTSEEYPGGSMVLRGIAPDGSAVWASAWRPHGGGARTRGVAVTASATYVSGVVSATVGGEGCHEIGSFGWFLRAGDASGNRSWLRSLPDWRTCTSTAGGPVGVGGGLVVLGTTSYIEGYSDIHGRLIAFDESGDRRWTNEFEPFPVGGPEGYDADNVLAIAVDPAGRTYAAGWAWRYPHEFGNDREAALMALGPGGGRRWVRVFGEPGQPRDDLDRGTDVDVSGDAVLFAAIMDVATGASVAHVVMLDSHGATVWSADFPAATSYMNTAQVALGVDGSAYVATRRPSTPRGHDLVIRKLGPSGEVLWITRLRSNGRMGDLGVSVDALYVLTHGQLLRFPA